MTIPTSDKENQLAKEKDREELVVLARQSEGTWDESEGRGTALEIVRRLREEWITDRKWDIE